MATIDGQPVSEDSGVVVGISEERIGGFAGCNTYSGPYAVEKNQVTIGPLASTRVACDDALMEREASFFLALEAADRFQIVADRLELVSEGGELLATFDLASPSNE